MEISVADAARKMGVSESRIRKLLQEQDLSGRKIGPMWIVDESSLKRRSAISRPLSPRMSWALIQAGSEHRLDSQLQIQPSEKYRLKKMVHKLLAEPDQVLLLQSWLKNRARRVELSCVVQDIPDLAADPRIVKSGISDSRAGMSAGSEVEFYINKKHWPALKAEFLLVKSSRPNVFAHLVEHQIPDPPPLLLVAADLADHNNAREDGQAQQLIKRITRP